MRGGDPRRAPSVLALGLVVLAIASLAGRVPAARQLAGEDAENRYEWLSSLAEAEQLSRETGRPLCAVFL